MVLLVCLMTSLLSRSLSHDDRRLARLSSSRKLGRNATVRGSKHCQTLVKCFIFIYNKMPFAPRFNSPLAQFKLYYSSRNIEENNPTRICTHTVIARNHVHGPKGWMGGWGEGEVGREANLRTKRSSQKFPGTRSHFMDYK